MRSLPFAAALVLGVLGPVLPQLRAEFTLFKNYWGDVIVSTDMTPEGRAITPPTPDNPTYYLGRSLGNKLGSIAGDRLPDEREMNQFVAKVLARQGYVGATPGVNEPDLFLVVQWGYLRPGSDDLLWFLGYNPAQDIGSPVFPGALGPEVFRTGFRSRVINTILNDAGNPIYGIIVTAFEYKSARTDKPIIYWQTRIGLPANGKSMAEAVPTMFLAAGAAIGRPSDSPVLLDADNARQGRVNLGELQFLDVLNDTSRGKNKGGKD